MLLAAYEGLNQRQAIIPKNGRTRVTETLAQIPELYQTADRPDQAASWKTKLEEFERSQTNRRAAAPPAEPPP